MAFENIVYTEADGIAQIEISRPRAFNALNTKTNSELEQALEQIEGNPEIRVLIIRGSEKVFVAGADVSELMDAGPDEALDNCCLAHRVFQTIENLDIPVIAAVNGPALGGGLELALSCDFRIGGEGSVFGLPEINLGIIPGAGGTQRLARLVGLAHAREMIFLGEKIKSERALEIGLINRRVADDVVKDEALALAGKLCKRPAKALALAKECVNYSTNADLGRGLEFEKKKFSSAFATADQKEGMKAFFERRAPVFTNK